MTDQLEFDEQEARQEEATYETQAIADRRRLVREMLDLQPGEAALSIGCGPGFEPAELAELVGRDGHIHAIDRSEAMLALTQHRCADLSQVTLARGDAVDLPVREDVFDAAVAVQVYEYVENIETAVDELYRALRPNGRAVVCDADFDALVWRSTNSERMERVLDAYDDHCSRPRLGSELAPYLQDAGLRVEQVKPNTILNTQLDEDTFAYHLLQHLTDYAATHDAIGPEQAKKWAADLRELDRMGHTFFSYTQYLYAVRKPQ